MKEAIVGQKVMLNFDGQARFKRLIRGKVEVVDPRDETAVKVRISEPEGLKGNLRTFSLRYLCEDSHV